MTCPKFDITALGEVLIDFLSVPGAEGKPTYEANPGGAPGNMAVMASRLGKKAAFIGKVGNDHFGRLLKDTLGKNGVCTDGIIVSDDYFTTLAFVTLDENGDRSFSFARKNSADVMLTPGEIDSGIISSSKVFHCGSLSLTDKACADATFHALSCAKEAGAIISVDPNLRLNLWKSEDEARQAIRTVLKYADIIKISDDEVRFLYGGISPEEAAEKIKKDFAPQIAFITCGADGAYMAGKDYFIYCPCPGNINVADTTGCGDCFCACALSRILDSGKKPADIGRDEAEAILRFAVYTASLSAEKRGAIPSMPYPEEIKNKYGDNL